jgi:hypothetical protein
VCLYEASECSSETVNGLFGSLVFIIIVHNPQRVIDTCRIDRLMEVDDIMKNERRLRGQFMGFLEDLNSFIG